MTSKPTFRPSYYVLKLCFKVPECLKLSACWLYFFLLHWETKLGLNPFTKKYKG